MDRLKQQKPLMSSEICEYLGKTGYETATRISLLRSTHRFNIVNTSKHGSEAAYVLKGFLPPKPKKVKSKEKAKRSFDTSFLNPLIEKVFCGDWSHEATV